MDTLIEKIKARINELEQERQKLVDNLNEQANALLNPYNSALAELKKLLPPEEDEESPIQEEQHNPFHHQGGQIQSSIGLSHSGQ